MSAIEGDRVTAVFKDLNPEEKAFFDAVTYNPTGIMHYQIDREPSDYMTFFDQATADTIAVYQTEKGDRKEGRVHQVFAQLSPSAVAAATQSGQQADLHSLISERLRILYPDIEADIQDSHGQWIDRMLPLFYVGYLNILHNFLTNRKMKRQNIYFCGDYLSQALVTGAAHSGFRAAADIARDWQDNKEP